MFFRQIYIMMALAALAHAGPADVPRANNAEELVSLLSANEWSTRQQGVIGLQALGELAIPALEKALESRDPNTRLTAQSMLRKMKEPITLEDDWEELGRKYKNAEDIKVGQTDVADKLCRRAIDILDSLGNHNAKNLAEALTKAAKLAAMRQEPRPVRSQEVLLEELREELKKAGQLLVNAKPRIGFTPSELGHFTNHLKVRVQLKVEGQEEVWLIKDDNRNIALTLRVISDGPRVRALPFRNTASKKRRESNLPEVNVAFENGLPVEDVYDAAILGRAAVDVPLQTLTCVSKLHPGPFHLPERLSSAHAFWTEVLLQSMFRDWYN